MNYYELEFNYTSEIEKEIVYDVLAAELGGIGFESFVEHENGMQAYIAESLFDENRLDQLLADFPLDNVVIAYNKKLIEGQDWNEEWEKNYFKPITINKECVIHASFHQIEPGFQYNIVIDPKMAFGTGNHETTYLMISHVLEMELHGKEVLDMGCGTAVLAILAKMRGADRVVAVDIDEWAYKNSLENVRLNNTEDIQVVLGGAEQIPNIGMFDIVLANINRNILLNDISRYANCIKPQGCLYMSGFYKQDVGLIEAEALKYGFVIESVTEKNNWVAVKVVRNNLI